jgi:pyruvate carboxylase
VRAQAIGETDDNGFRRVFFELNGQPRMVRIADRAHGGTGTQARRKAEEGNPNQVAAPMPGVVSTLMVTAGQAVKAGDTLLSIEAMKMETAIRAEHDGTIAEVLVGVGNQIDAKDLLVVYAGQA